MPDHIERIGVLVGDDLELAVVFDAKARIDELAVDLASERGFREARADAERDVGNRQGIFVRTDGAVWELDVDHDLSLNSNACDGNEPACGHKKRRRAPLIEQLRTAHELTRVGFQ
jgi:hypothetical protein